MGVRAQRVQHRVYNHMYRHERTNSSRLHSWNDFWEDCEKWRHQKLALWEYLLEPICEGIVNDKGCGASLILKSPNSERFECTLQFLLLSLKQWNRNEALIASLEIGVNTYLYSVAFSWSSTKSCRNNKRIRKEWQLNLLRKETYLAPSRGGKSWIPT